MRIMKGSPLPDGIAFRKTGKKSKSATFTSTPVAYVLQQKTFFAALPRFG
jgi:hypothetical protein